MDLNKPTALSDTSRALVLDNLQDHQMPQPRKQLERLSAQLLSERYAQKEQGLRYPPFDFCPKDGTQLCGVEDTSGIIRPTCPACGFVHWGNPTTATDTIVRAANGSVLLVQLKNGKWAIPGGNSEYWESQEASALRELREETGLIARGVVLLDAYKLIPPPAARFVNLYLAISPFTTTDEQTPVQDPMQLFGNLSPDASEGLTACAFFPPGQLPTMAWPDHERVLNLLFQGWYDHRFPVVSEENQGESASRPPVSIRVKTALAS